MIFAQRSIEWRTFGLLLAVVMMVSGLNATPAGAQVDPPSVVMVVGDPGAVGAGDAAVRDRLESLGFTVSVIDDNGVTAGRGGRVFLCHHRLDRQLVGGRVGIPRCRRASVGSQTVVAG